MGVTWASFHWLGTLPSLNDFRNITVSGVFMLWLHSLSIRECILSGPGDLSGFSLVIAFSTSWYVIFGSLIGCLNTLSGSVCIVSRFSCVNTLAKNVLSTSAFSVSSLVRHPFCVSSGLSPALELVWLLTYFQKAFGLVFASFAISSSKFRLSLSFSSCALFLFLQYLSSSVFVSFPCPVFLLTCLDCLSIHPEWYSPF